MDAIKEDRKYKFPRYWKLLKVSKKQMDTPTKDHLEDLYHQFSFSQIVYSMKSVLIQTEKDIPRDEINKLFGDRSVKINTATSKIYYMSEKLRHSKDTRDSVHTAVLVEARIVIGFNDNTGCNKTNRNKNNKTNDEDTIFSYVSSIRNEDVKVNKETFDECFEEIKDFAKKYFDIE